jgi:hypothetical protein
VFADKPAVSALAGGGDPSFSSTPFGGRIFSAGVDFFLLPRGRAMPRIMAIEGQGPQQDKFSLR